MTTTPNYGDDAVTPSEDEDSLKKLRRFGGELGKKTVELWDLEEKVRAKKAEIENLAESQIPLLMKELDITELKMTGGFVVTLKTDLVGSFPKDPDKRAKAFAYLKEVGDDELILREVSVELPRDSTADAEALMKFLEESGVRKRAKKVENSESLNHQSMLGYLRRQVKAVKEAREEGDAEVKDVPLDLFGVFEKSVANIKVGTR